MSILAPQRQIKAVSETRNVAVSFVGRLDSGELLTGTPTIVEVTTSDLTLSNKLVNTAALTVNGEAVAIAQGVQLKIVGGTANVEYEIRITCDTDASPAQTLIGSVKLLVVDD